jgi:Protein of unknown function (DUF2711)
MNYSQFAYPSYKIPLLQAYDGRFDAAFIVLHPFFRMPALENEMVIAPGDHDIEGYPDDLLIRQQGQPVYWRTIMQGIGCEDLRRFYIGMRSSIYALNREYENKEMSRLICDYTDQAEIYHPIEGRIEPLLVEPITEYVSNGYTENVFYLAEFEKQPEELSAESIIQKCEGFVRGSLFNTNNTRLATVDWDDFFTVIYGSKDELVRLHEGKGLEGFFCDTKTMHEWCWQSKVLKPVVPYAF